MAPFFRHARSCLDPTLRRGNKVTWIDQNVSPLVHISTQSFHFLVRVWHVRRIVLYSTFCKFVFDPFACKIRIVCRILVQVRVIFHQVVFDKYTKVVHTTPDCLDHVEDRTGRVS